MGGSPGAVQCYTAMGAVGAKGTSATSPGPGLEPHLVSEQLWWTVPCVSLRSTQSTVPTSLLPSPDHGKLLSCLQWWHKAED